MYYNSIGEGAPHIQAMLRKGKRKVTVLSKVHVANNPVLYYRILLPYTEQEVVARRPSNEALNHELVVRKDSIIFAKEEWERLIATDALGN